MQPTRTQLAAGAFILLLATGAAVGSAIALAGHASGVTLVAAVGAGLAGIGLGWTFRSHLRPFSGNPSHIGWWLILAVVLGGLLIATPNGVQLITVSLLSGFLLACCVVVGRRQLGTRRRLSG
jgi:hypothetical protein